MLRFSLRRFPASAPRTPSRYSFAPRLSEKAFKVFCANITKAREEWIREADVEDARWGFQYEGRDYYFGRRFLDDNAVMQRIESAITDEAEFLADPYAWCIDALRDCASADHWYAFEKDYG